MTQRLICILVLVIVVLTLTILTFVSCSSSEPVAVIDSNIEVYAGDTVAMPQTLTLQSNRISVSFNIKVYTVNIDNTDFEHRLTWLELDDWNSDKSPADYVSVNFFGLGGSVMLLKPFSSKIKLEVWPRYNTSLVKSCVIDCASRLVNFKLTPLVNDSIMPAMYSGGYAYQPDSSSLLLLDDLTRANPGVLSLELEPYYFTEYTLSAPSYGEFGFGLEENLDPSKGPVGVTTSYPSLSFNPDALNLYYEYLKAQSTDGVFFESWRDDKEFFDFYYTATFRSIECVKIDRIVIDNAFDFFYNIFHFNYDNGSLDPLFLNLSFLQKWCIENSQKLFMLDIRFTYDSSDMSAYYMFNVSGGFVDEA